MKKIFITLLALTLATACKADESKQIAELKKRCAELSKETGKEYLYGSGELKNYAKAVRLTHATPTLDSPDPYWAGFMAPDKKLIQISIRTSWKNPNAPLGELESVPLHIKMEIGKTYQFCYGSTKIESEEFFYIDHPETIQLIKE